MYRYMHGPHDTRSVESPKLHWTSRSASRDVLIESLHATRRTTDEKPPSAQTNTPRTPNGQKLKRSFSSPFLDSLFRKKGSDAERTRNAVTPTTSRSYTLTSSPSSSLDAIESPHSPRARTMRGDSPSSPLRSPVRKPSIPGSPLRTPDGRPVLLRSPLRSPGGRPPMPNSPVNVHMRAKRADSEHLPQSERLVRTSPIKQDASTRQKCNGSPLHSGPGTLQSSAPFDSTDSLRFYSMSLSTSRTPSELTQHSAEPVSSASSVIVQPLSLTDVSSESSSMELQAKAAEAKAAEASVMATATGAAQVNEPTSTVNTDPFHIAEDKAAKMAPQAADVTDARLSQTASEIRASQMPLPSTPSWKPRRSFSTPVATPPSHKNSMPVAIHIPTAAQALASAKMSTDLGLSEPNFSQQNRKSPSLHGNPTSQPVARTPSRTTSASATSARAPSRKLGTPIGSATRSSSESASTPPLRTEIHEAYMRMMQAAAELDSGLTDDSPAFAISDPLHTVLDMYMTEKEPSSDIPGANLNQDLQPTFDAIDVHTVDPERGTHLPPRFPGP